MPSDDTIFIFSFAVEKSTLSENVTNMEESRGTPPSLFSGVTDFITKISLHAGVIIGEPEIWFDDLIAVIFVVALFGFSILTALESVHVHSSNANPFATVNLTSKLSPFFRLCDVTFS